MIVACRSMHSGESWGPDATAVAALFGNGLPAVPFCGRTERRRTRHLRDDPFQPGKFSMMTCSGLTCEPKTRDPTW